MNTKQDILKRILLSTNANTNELPYESIFDAIVLGDERISKEEFIRYFNGKTSIIGTPLKEEKIQAIFENYNFLYNYSHIIKQRVK